MKFKPGDVVRLKGRKRESVVERESIMTPDSFRLLVPLSGFSEWWISDELELVYRPNSKQFKVVRAKK